MTGIPIGDAMQIVSVGILTGIFFRMGRLGATIEGHDKRLTNLEGKPT